jgi:hypothetical protein
MLEVALEIDLMTARLSDREIDRQSNEAIG